jgi:transcriptional regulator with XRE-family HTH domain
MGQNTDVAPPAPAPDAHGDAAALHTGDLARRVARRRTELGKSIEEVAARAGIDPGYLRYFEESAGARLSGGSMLLLALALETSPEDLVGGRIERPPGRGRAGRHPQLSELTAEQCRAHLAAGGVGRVLLVSARGPIAHPVNFVVSEGSVVLTTTVAQAEALEDQGLVGFQIDRVDDSMSEGWSVLVSGRAERVDDPDEVLALSALGLEPWAGGARHALVRIAPTEVTGRVIAQANAGG